MARELAAEPASSGQRGAPLVPTGNPMLDAIGPGSYAQRRDVPDLTMHGKPKIVPLRLAAGFHVDHRDPDPRGMPVLGADGEPAGSCQRAVGRPGRAVDRVLRSEPGRTVWQPSSVLLPVNFSTLSRSQGNIKVKAIYAHQFADVPALASDAADHRPGRRQDLRLLRWRHAVCRCRRQEPFI